MSRITKQQRLVVLKATLESFEEELGLSLRQREVMYRTGYNNPTYIYGFTTCNRLQFFSKELTETSASLRDFPELTIQKELNSWGSVWFPIDDVQSRINVLKEAIKRNETWS